MSASGLGERGRRRQRGVESERAGPNYLSRATGRLGVWDTFGSFGSSSFLADDMSTSVTNVVAVVAVVAVVHGCLIDDDEWSAHSKFQPSTFHIYTLTTPRR